MRRRAPAVALLALVAASAHCTFEAPPAGETPSSRASLASGAARIDVDSSGGLTLSLGDRALTRVPLDAIAVGLVPSIDDLNYDPYPLLVPNPLYTPIEGLAWARGARLDVVTAEPTRVTARLTLEAKGATTTATLDARVGADQTFDLSLVPDEPTRVAYVELGATLDPDEGLYGLGESFDDVNQRGKVRGMQLELDSELEGQNNEAHVPMPFLVGTTGWGLFVEDRHPMVFDVASTDTERARALVGTGKDTAQGVAFHLFVEARPLDLTRHLYDLVGYPRLPATWGLGPVLWRDENVDQAQAQGDIDAIRDLDLATTAMWIDRPYASAVNTFDWATAQFPDGYALVQRAGRAGLPMGLWHVPYLDEMAERTASLRAQAEERHVYPKTTGLLLNKWGKPIDFTNEDGKRFWQQHVADYTARGIQGFKLDYGEDVVPGITLGRLAWEFADGSTEQTMHGAYQLGYHAAYAELLPEDGGFLLCRHSTYGDQANGPIIWPGDLDASFAKHREHVEDGADSYVAVGGLPASMIAGLTLGPSGFPFYGSDTGGYRHAPPDKELFTRWFEQTALSSVMQIGNGASTVAWEPDAATGFDDEMLGWYRSYTRLHLRLWAYEWTLARAIAATGRPIQIPVGLAYPEIGAHPSDEYLFGDALLVAPVLERGATSRDVLFPPGRWVGFFDNVAHGADAASTEHVDAPLDVLPLYLAPGAIVPMLRPTIDAIAPTEEPERVDSFATDPGVLWVRVAPGPTSSLLVFDGTALTQAEGAASVTFSITPGDLFRSGAVVELAGVPTPTLVKVDGVEAPLVNVASLPLKTSAYSLADDGLASVHVGVGAHTIELSY